MDTSQYMKSRQYELMVIFVPDQPEAETSAAVEAVVSYITDENGTIDSISTESPWGRRRLAYTIRHEGVDYRDGYYALAYFTSMPDAISNIERELKLDVNVIRYLLLSYDENMGEKIDESALQEAAEATAEVEATEEAADVVEAEVEATEEAAEAVEAEVEVAEEAADVVEAEVEATEEATADVIEAEAPVEEEAVAADVASEEDAAKE